MWRRYSEFKKLHNNLKTVFSQANELDDFPEFIKGKIFGIFINYNFLYTMSRVSLNMEYLIAEEKDLEHNCCYKHIFPHIAGELPW